MSGYIYATGKNVFKLTHISKYPYNVCARVCATRPAKYFHFTDSCEIFKGKAHNLLF
jgi:hypothetical protein